MAPNFVILNAGAGYRVKSYGPKCLLKLSNGESVLERQVRIIKNKYKKATIYQSVGFESYKVHKKTRSIFDTENPLISENEKFETTSSLFSLKKTLLEYNIEECFVLYGDIVFDENHIPNIPNQSTIFSSQNHRSSKIGITSNNGWATYVLWGLENSWAETLYADKNLCEFIKTSDYPDNAYLVEALNDYMVNNKIKLEPFGSDIIDIDLLSDLDIANAKFNISKIYDR